MFKIRVGAASLASLIAMIQSVPAFAQSSSTTPPEASKPVAQEEIIVTAQRRSETLERTPVAVSVLSGALLQRQAIATEADLQVATPGLTIRAGQNSNQLNYALRGQSLDAFSDTRPGVLPYFNEIQLDGVGGGSSAFYDLQSVQVLKGPQGTLFGRNSTGGAVLFTSTKPTRKFGGYISGRLGNYKLRQVEGALNLPVVSDTVLFRVAGFYEKRDGYQLNLFNNKRVGDVDRYGLRGSLHIGLSNSISNDLVVDYLHSDGNSLGGLINSLEPTGLVPLIALTNFGNQAQYNFLINAFTGGAAGCNATTNNCAAAYAAAHPTLDPGGIASYLATQQARGPYKIESDGPSKYKGRNIIISNITSIDVGSDTKLRNIFGYTYLKNGIAGDIDGTPYGIDDNGNGGKNDNTRQYSEELQLVGKALGGRLNFVVGGFYSHETNENLTTSLLLQFPPLTSTTVYNKLTTRGMYAGYGQGTYDLSEAIGVQGLGITVGARYTHEKIKFDVLPADTAYLAPPAQLATYDFHQQKSFGNVSWTLGLQEQVNPNLLIYVASRRSYKNGGYNGIQNPVPGLGPTGGNGYGLETLTDAEVGLKYRGRIGGIPTNFNIAVYQDWIKDGQRVAYTLLGSTPAAVTVNIPRSKVSGVEFDGSIRPASWLTLGGAVNYTNARFTDSLVSIGGGAPVLFGTYPDTPKWSGSVFGEVNVPIHNSITASLRSDVYSQSLFWFASTGNRSPGAHVDGYTLVNFRLGVEDSAAGWAVSAHLKNAFNRVYYAGGIATGELFQFNTVVPGSPRTFFVDARFKF
ncbi:TonB-dependent receptor plug domain-containing protein [Sphingomonas sp.]|uniref:TonB-dependent receptor n=1 Tax=Sphingomonas sp. TaxID=28214 RepID=UPI00286A3FF8|nr:TonB-dependent receptor plug domain-containing protein [Sphingomonas sp.]